MRRYGSRPGHKFVARDWSRDWLRWGPHEPTTEQLILRNEIEIFRLVLAKKEPRDG